MQRLQQRASKAVNQATRRKALTKIRHQRVDHEIEGRRTARHCNVRRQLLHQERENRRDAWDRGPLAKVQDIDSLHKNRLPASLQPNTKLTSKKPTRRLPQGSKRQLRQPVSQRFVPGDRVCCIASKGEARRWRGQIGVVLQSNVGDGKRSGCLVEGIGIRRNATTLAHEPVPHHLLIPVRTVTNPFTNRPEDILIGLPPNMHNLASTPALDPTDPLSPEATAQAREIQQERLRLRAQRRADNRAKASRNAPEVPEHEIDTLRYEVEARSWTPALLSAPMPTPVIDELRNRYSKFRTWHEPEYIARIDREEQQREEKEDKDRQGVGMLPIALQEMSLRDKHQREAAQAAAAEAEGREKDMPNDSVLELLGRHMVESGAAAPDSSRSTVPQRIGVAAASAASRRIKLRRNARDRAARYWPIKGWRTRRDREIRRDVVDDD